jgi:rubrerythrin
MKRMNLETRNPLTEELTGEIERLRRCGCSQCTKRADDLEGIRPLKLSYSERDRLARFTGVGTMWERGWQCPVCGHMNFDIMDATCQWCDNVIWW